MVRKLIMEKIQVLKKLHKQFPKVIGHLKPVPQKTINCPKKGRCQPGTIPQGRRHVLWFIKSLGIRMLFPWLS